MFLWQFGQCATSLLWCYLVCDQDWSEGSRNLPWSHLNAIEIEFALPWFSPLTFTMNFSEVNKKDGGSVRFSPLKFTLLPGRQTQTRKQEWKFWRGYLHGHFDYGGNQGFLWTYASSFLNLWISISMVSCMSCTSQQWCKGAWPWVWGILPEIPLPSSSSSPASP